MGTSTGNTPAPPELRSLLDRMRQSCRARSYSPCTQKAYIGWVRRYVLFVLAHMRGTPRLMSSLMYGAGLRLLECCRLRVKDVDFGRRVITVRDGKGGKDRETLLPASLVEPLRSQLERGPPPARAGPR